jgi:hypothetical protein
MRRLPGQLPFRQFREHQWSINVGGENRSCLTMDHSGFSCDHPF